VSVPFQVQCVLDLHFGLYERAALAFLMYYLLDCLDGNMARRYDMVTQFGDYFDHIRDWIGGACVVSMIVWRWWILSPPFSLVTLPVLVISTIISLMMVLHMACQEAYHAQRCQIDSRERFQTTDGTKSSSSGLSCSSSGTESLGWIRVLWDSLLWDRNNCLAFCGSHTDVENSFLDMWVAWV